MLRVIRSAFDAARRAVADGADPDAIAALPILADIGRMRDWLPEDAATRADDLARRVGEEVTAS
jgi:predicted HD phosphohydrolase